MTFRRCVLWVAVGVLPAINADAQPRLLEFEPAVAGACTIVVILPDSNAVIENVTVDDGAIALSRMSQAGDIRVRIPLTGPLQQGDQLKVTLRSSTPDPPVATATVGPGVSGNLACRTGAKKPPDDRNVFELDGFVGLAIDNFAPKNIGGYPESAASTRSRRTFGVIGQYRLWGTPGDDRQLWLAGGTLNGMRTADIDCADPEQAVLCKGGNPDTSGSLNPNVQKVGIQVLEHASTLEAHVDLRFEFLTLERRASTPAKVFGFYRYGFIDVINPVTTCTATANSSCAAAFGQTTNTSVGLSGTQAGAFSANYAGIGALLPSGSFRNSAITYGLANEDIYGTSRGGWKRKKLTAVAFVDILPQLGDFSVGKWLGFGSWRGFLALDVDRTRRDYGPDAIETYVGFVFDFGKAFQ